MRQKILPTKRQFLNSAGTLALCAVLTMFNPQSAHACTNPAGSAGDQFYNVDFNVMQYCDGTDWTAMRGGTTAIQLIDADSDTLIQVEEGADDDTIHFDTAGTERLVIDETGKVELPGDGRKLFFGGINTWVGENTNSDKLSLRGGGTVSSQTVYIDNEGRLSLGLPSPDSSAMLQIETTDKGFLPPRVSDPSSDIASPATGLVAYDITDDELQVFDGTAWAPMNGAGGVTALNDLTDAINDGSSIFIGNNAGINDDLTTNNNVGIGEDTLMSNISGQLNTALGNSALKASTTVNNTAVGYNSLYQAVGGTHNTGLGSQALREVTSGSYNSTVGVRGFVNNSTGDHNTAIGYEAGGSPAGTIGDMDNNTAIGYRAGHGMIGGASGLGPNNNTLLGYQAGDLITLGDDNIIIGYNTDPSSATASNELNIGNTIYGDLSTGRIGIGTTVPSDGSGSGGQALKLDVEGAVGATHFCDEVGLNCTTATALAAATGGNVDELVDADSDTQIQVEEGADDDTIRFDTAGTQRMMIANNGKIRFGTNDLSSAYDFQVNTDNNGVARFVSSEGAYVLAETTNDTSAGSVFVLKNPSQQWNLSLNSVDASNTENDFRIVNNTIGGRLDFLIQDTTGNIGIGTDSPTADLDVSIGRGAAGNGIRVLDATDSDNARLVMRNSTAGHGVLEMYDVDENETISIRAASGATYFNIDSNFGIGTDNPTHKLSVEDSTTTPSIGIINRADTSANRSGNLDFTHSNNSSARIQATRASGDSDGMNMKFFTEPTTGGGLVERMRIDAEGRIGMTGELPDANAAVNIGKLAGIDHVLRLNSATNSGADIYYDQEALIVAENGIMIGLDANNDTTNESYRITKDITNTAGTEDVLFRVREDGLVGIGNNDLDGTVTITGATDLTGVNTQGEGGIVIQDNTNNTSGRKIRIDANEIQASNDNAAATLFLNTHGGGVQVGNGNLAVGDSVSANYRINIDATTDSTGGIFVQANTGDLPDVAMQASGLIVAEDSFTIGIDGDNGGTAGVFRIIKDAMNTTTPTILFKVREDEKTAIGEDFDGIFTITGTADIGSANADGDGVIVIQDEVGNNLGRKLRIDSNEIQASNANVRTTLLLNPFGADVQISGQNRGDGELDMSGGRIIDMADPTSGAHGATKSYVDTAVSDLRLKKDVVDMDSYGLNTIMALRPVNYNWIAPTDNVQEGKQFGFIAQEIGEVVPELIITKDDAMKTVTYKHRELSSILTKAVQELKTMFDDLKSKVSNNNDRIEKLESENAELKKRLDALEARMAE